MQISIRLYRQHDMDLIRMYMNKSFKFTSEMKNALISFANNTPYQIITPNDTLPEYQGYLKTSIMLNIGINEKKNPEVIVLLRKIKNGQRNAFIKTVMRSSMDKLPVSAYFIGDGIIMSKETALSMEEKGETVEGNSALVNKLNKPAAKTEKQIIKETKPKRESVNLDPLSSKTPVKNTTPEADLIPTIGSDGNLANNDILNPISNGTHTPDTEINDTFDALTALSY